MGRLFFNVHLWLFLVGLPISALFAQGRHTVHLSVNSAAMPVQQPDQTLFFVYTGEGPQSNQVQDGYQIQRLYFGTALGLGLSYGITDHLRVSLQGRSFINSFVPRNNRVGRSSGHQFNVGVHYEHFMGGKTYFVGGLLFSSILGQYGIAAPTPTAGLLVDNTTFAGSPLAFALVDQSWSGGVQLGLSYAFSPAVSAYVHLGYQVTFGQQTHLLLIGEDIDGAPTRLRRSLDDPNLFLQVNQETVRSNNPTALPYRFGGASAEIGLRFRLYHPKER